MRNLAIKVIDRLFLVVYGTASPSETEWANYLAMVERQGIEGISQLVVTDGGEPTPAQRRRLADVIAGHVVPVAIVSPSAFVRHTVTALSWFNRNTKTFPPSELREAIAYLEIPATRADLIEKELRKLQAGLRSAAAPGPS
jgi:hypothetical protein